VECGKVYAMLVTSNNGLWRYEIGDTVEFTSTTPAVIGSPTHSRQIASHFASKSGMIAVPMGGARSSGTTSDRSKYIPVTRESLWWNHTLGMRDVATLYADGPSRHAGLRRQDPDARRFVRVRGANLVGTSRRC